MFQAGFVSKGSGTSDFRRLRSHYLSGGLSNLAELVAAASKIYPGRIFTFSRLVALCRREIPFRAIFRPRPGTAERK